MPLPNRHGQAGTLGTNLQNPPVVRGEKQQSYILGLPSARMPIRPMATAAPSSAVPGTPVEYQSGNPNIQAWDTRAQARNPMYGAWNNAGWDDSGNAKLPGDQMGDPQGKVAPRMPFQEGTNLGGWSVTNDKLVTRDRHVFWKVGNELSGRNSGLTDPPMDGPPRPSLVSVNRTINWQQGTVYANSQFHPVNVVNGNADDLSRAYDREPVMGMFIGEQGSGWAAVYGGVPGLYQPYGSYAGVTAGPVKGIQSPVDEGQPGDGPRKVFSGPPHGMHSPTLPDYASTLGYYMAQPAPRAPRMDRPDNSRIGGQSFSQTVQPQGQTGTVAQHNIRGASNGNVWNKVRYAPGGGWRGQ